MSERYRAGTLRNGKTRVYSGVENDANVDDRSFGVVDSIKRLWGRLQFDEWTFTLMLFLFSSSIVIGKLFLNHDYFSFLDINSDQITSSVFNKTHPYYKDIAYETVIEPLIQISWLFKALLSGLGITGLTWFIIYQDSNVPGVNPPSPFNLSQERITETPPLQINYLVGILTGFMVFLYMCL